MSNKVKLSLLDRFILFFAVLAAIGLGVGMLAGQTDPRDEIWIAFAGLAYPFLLIANLLFVLLWFLRRRVLFGIATLAFIALGWKTFTATFQFFGEEGSTVKDSEHYVRMMTYNVHQFKKYGENNDVSTKDQIIKVIENQHPDIICFQEFFTRRKGEYDLIDSIKKRLKLKHYYFVPSVDNNYEAAGLAIFSRYPIKDKGKVSFGEFAGNGSIYADVDVKGQVFRIYNVHFQSISFQKEDYEYIDKVAKKMGPEYKSSRRIAGMLKAAFQRRSEQVAMMKSEMQHCKIPYVIAGDFNDTPASYCVGQITHSLKNSFKEKGRGFGKTYNGAFPNFQIDYIATTKDFDVINHHISQDKLSDHFPVRSDLRLNFSLQNDDEDY
ncbi:endonuclease/exonuclease/phosphatase family protein [Pedobacter xixiisoli]|uniref:Metal-dependent hydrolase, endonuclease/exonuclease/phosphatase family n=1 Tax=Pedobacter xixiisoli TaxID=1476464 RepID=A0A286AF58_9SPHI|nr:endonuclease/exonuclease/phosphatase family protein [Pedobacter xixiisoli]SOD20530.1 Metal-dependent hydrolase, endonuclease/exonuclease/phosphatase family [Pedobacter xixiisoli]